MIIELGNDHARLVSATERERRWLEDFLSIKDASARYNPHSDGRISLISEVLGTFPAGFAVLVMQRGQKAGLTIELLDKRVCPIKQDPRADVGWLRDYQLEAVNEARIHPRGIFHHATGAGKTEIMVALGEVYNCTWLILTHRKSLMYQTAKRWAKRTGEEVGIIGEGIFRPRRITVGTFQSVRAAMRKKRIAFQRFFASIQAVGVDEVHVVPAKSFRYVLSHLPNAYYRYGFSGTPFARGDKKGVYVIGMVGPRIHRIRAGELIDKEVLAEPRIVMVPFKQKPLKGMYSEVYEALVATNADRNRLVLKIARKAEKPAFLFVRALKHGKALEKLLHARGIPCEFVWGRHKEAERQAAIRRLVHGDIDVLICNVVFQEGIDVPELQSVITAMGGKSIIATLQNLGRGMRRRDEKGQVTKAKFDVFDVADSGCGCRKMARRHTSCKWFDRHTRGRMKTYAAERFTVVEDSSLA